MIDKHIQTILIKDSGKKTVGNIENVLSELIDKELVKEKKDFSKMYNVNKNNYLIKNGFLGYGGICFVQIRIYKYVNGIKQYIESDNESFIDKLLIEYPQIDHIIILTNIDTKSYTQSINQKICWINDKYDNVDFILLGSKELNELLSDYNMEYEEFEKSLDNYEELKLRKSILSKLADNKQNINKHNFIELIRDEYKQDNLVLFLGSGASVKAGIPNWNLLLNKMFIVLITQLVEQDNIIITDEERKSILNSFKDSESGAPLLQARYLKTGLKEKFMNVLFKTIYEEHVESSDLIDQIVRLCIPPRDRKGIYAIVNYNFDDLIECNLKSKGVRYKSIYKDADYPQNNELPIYHVHGYIPRDRTENDIDYDDSIVFSEDGYHERYNDQYHWSNLTQLTLMKERCCIFIGLSMSDPNLRRLLEVANSKNADIYDTKHYAILRREKIKIAKRKRIKGITTFEKSNEVVRENYFKSIGINVIWIDEFDEIPKILKELQMG